MGHDCAKSCKFLSSKPLLRLYRNGYQKTSSMCNLSLLKLINRLNPVKILAIPRVDDADEQVAPVGIILPAKELAEPLLPLRVK